MSPREHKSTLSTTLALILSKLLPLKNADGTTGKQQMQQKPRRKIGPPSNGISKEQVITGRTSNMIQPPSHSLT